MRLNKNQAKIVAFLIWFILWANFIARDLYKKGYFTDYNILARSNSEEKHAYTYGRDFYELLKFAKNAIPENASYDFTGVKDFSVESRRGIYYMYPLLRNKNPDFLLVYDTRGFEKDGFRIYAELDDERFILKKE